MTKHAFPVIGHKRIDTVTTADVLAALTPIWIEHPETSTRVKQRLGKVLDYSMAHGWRSDNPAALGRGTGTGILVMEPLQKGRYVLDLKQQPDLTPLRDYGLNTWAQPCWPGSFLTAR